MSDDDAGMASNSVARLKARAWMGLAYGFGFWFFVLWSLVFFFVFCCKNEENKRGFSFGGYQPQRAETWVK